MYSFLSTHSKGKAIETPGGELVWRISEMPEVLREIVENQAAILGGDFCVVENDKRASFGAFGQFMPVWSTKPQSKETTWTEYCVRTLDESLSKLAQFAAMKELADPLHSSQGFIRPVIALPDDPILFVPRDKHDHARAEAAIAAGYPAVEPVLPQLLEWLQDMNWPVAQTLSPFIASIGPPLIPHLKHIFETDDQIWKYWIIQEVLQESKELTFEFRDVLSRISQNPTDEEKEEELDVESRKLLVKHCLV